MNHEDQDKPSPIAPIANAQIDPIFEATVQATEEAIVNALVAARTMTGVNGARYFGTAARRASRRSSSATTGSRNPAK